MYLVIPVGTWTILAVEVTQVPSDAVAGVAKGFGELDSLGQRKSHGLSPASGGYKIAKT